MIIDGFNVEIKRKTNMKKMIIRCVNNSLIISCPPHITIKYIENLLVKKHDYFVKELEKTKHDYSITYIGGVKYHVVLIDEKILNLIFEDDKILVSKGMEFKLIKEFMIDKVLYHYKKNEKKFKEILQLATLPKIYIKKLKSAYGKYNRAQHSIILDYRLAKYPEKFLDFIIAHEMCHIIHFNHSSKFYDLLEMLVPNCKQMHKELNSIKFYDGF